MVIFAALFLSLGLLATCGGGDDDDDQTPEELIWQDPPSDEWMTWNDAVVYCETLNIDKQDNWRLPTIDELRSLISGCEGTESDGACGVTDDCADSDCWSDPCDGCTAEQGPGSGGAYWPTGLSGEIGWYWSSSPVPDFDQYIWDVDFSKGKVNYHDKILDKDLVRCVR